MSGFLDGFFSTLLGLSPVLVYLVVFALVFAEDAIFIGFVIPGETAAVLAGVASSLGTTSFAPVDRARRRGRHPRRLGRL